MIKLCAGGGGGEWRTCAMRDDEPRPVWMSPLIQYSVCSCVCLLLQDLLQSCSRRGEALRRVDDMCYDRRRSEACVDESAHHALANARGWEIVGKKEGEQKGSARGSVHWGLYLASVNDNFAMVHVAGQ